MGRQIATFPLPDGYPDVEALIRTVPGVCFVPSRGHSATTVLSLKTLTLRAEEMGKTHLTMYLVRVDDFERIKKVYVPAQKYVVNPVGSPVVELVRGYFTGQALRGGRVYFQTERQLGGDINGFVAWASGVMTKIRKALQTAKVEGRTFYIGKSVRAWMEETGPRGRWPAPR